MCGEFPKSSLLPTFSGGINVSVCFESRKDRRFVRQSKARPKLICCESEEWCTWQVWSGCCRSALKNALGAGRTYNKKTDTKRYVFCTAAEHKKKIALVSVKKRLVID